MALCLEIALVALFLDGIDRMALDFRKVKGLPVVESVEILAEKDGFIRSLRRECKRAGKDGRKDGKKNLFHLNIAARGRRSQIRAVGNAPPARRLVRIDDQPEI